MKQLRYIILFFSLVVVSCADAQFVINPYLRGTEDTTPDGRQVFMIIGDSKARGNSDAVGTAPAANTVYQWDAGSNAVIAVGSGDLLEPVAAGAVGSQWPAFGTAYYNRTGYKPVLVNCGIGGASYVNSGNTNFSWYTDGSLYSNAVTKTNNCLANLGLTKVKAVFIIMGVNDYAQQSYTLATSYINSLIDRINTDYDTPKIYISIPAKANATNTQLTRGLAIRPLIRLVALTYSNVEIFANDNSLLGWGGYYQVDDYHFNFAGNEKLGEMIARQITLDPSYNKWTRSVLGSFYNDQSTARQQAYDAFFVSQVAAGNFDLLDEMHFYNADQVNNAVVDWSFCVNATPTNCTFHANSDIETSGSSGSHMSFSAPSRTIRNCDFASDFILGVRIKTNHASSTTAGDIMGVRESASGGMIEMGQQVSSQVYYRAGDATATTYTGITKFNNNKLYSVARNGSTKYLIEDITTLTSTTQAAVAMSPTNVLGATLGARNNNGTIDAHINAQFVYSFTAKYTTFNLSSFYTACETLNTALTATP